jgi:hypothetical protein
MGPNRMRLDRDWRGRFKEGITPWNKGTKGIMKVNSGSFGQGREHGTTLAVGFIRKRKSGNGGNDHRPRNWIKVAAPNKWLPYSRYVWIQKYGYIKKGDVIFFIDGDTLNEDIENLIALPRQKQSKYNRWKRPLTPETLKYFKSRYDNRRRSRVCN